MVTITFIYAHNGVKMYGKFIGDISDDANVAVDSYILQYLSPYFIDIYGEYEMQIGIIGVMDDNEYFCSDNEKNIFDILYIQDVYNNPIVYVHGNLIEN